MKKFQFKLEPYLKLKEMAEKKRLHELAQVSGQIDKNRQIIDFYYSEGERLQRGNNLQEDVSMIDKVRLTNNYLKGLRQKMEVAERENFHLQDELKKRQEILMEARREKKMVEVIKEKRYKEHQELVKQEELKEIDDYNINATNMKNARHVRFKRDIKNMENTLGDAL